MKIKQTKKGIPTKRNPYMSFEQVFRAELKMFRKITEISTMQRFSTVPKNSSSSHRAISNHGIIIHRLKSGSLVELMSFDVIRK